MFSPNEICAATDAALSLSGLQLVGSGYVARGYQGVLGGCRATAQLSVFVDRGMNVTGYRLTVEAHTGVPARFVAGRTIPVLLGRNLQAIASPWPSVPQLSLMAHDLPWARRFVDDPTLAQAMVTALQRTEFVEHRPGLLQVQVAGHHPTQDGLPTTVAALGTLAAGTLRPPGPPPAEARWSDNRSLVVAVIALLFFGFCGGLVALWWAL